MKLKGYQTLINTSASSRHQFYCSRRFPQFYRRHLPGDAQIKNFYHTAFWRLCQRPSTGIDPDTSRQLLFGSESLAGIHVRRFKFVCSGFASLKLDVCSYILISKVHGIGFFELLSECSIYLSTGFITMVAGL